MSHLVLSRKPDEKVRLRIPPSTEEQIIVVEVHGTNDYNAKLGFEADPKIEVLRMEVLDQARVADAAVAV